MAQRNDSTKTTPVPAGDGASLLATWKAERPRIERVIRRRLGALTPTLGSDRVGALAEDVANEVGFAVARRRDEKLRPEPPDARAWLLRVAINKAVSAFRAESRRLRWLLPPRDTPTDAAQEPAEDFGFLYDAIERAGLTSLERSVIEGDLRDESDAETARRLRITGNNVRQVRWRARRKLALALGRRIFG